MSGDGAEAWEAEQERIADEQRKVDQENERQRLMFERQLSEGKIAIGLPSGKSLQEATDALFRQAHFKIKLPHPRSVRARLLGMPSLADVLYFKPNQIAGVVADGIVAFGITGHDVVQEYNDYDARRDVHMDRLAVRAQLPYSRQTSGPTRAVAFTKEDNPIDDVSKIPSGESVASEYPMATIKLLYKHGIRATIIECTGGAESLVISGKCAYGVTLTETGDTLRANGLKIIGEVFESNTVLIANKNALEIPGICLCADFLARKLSGALAARGKVYLIMNAPANKVAEISAYLERLGATLRKPTVAPLFNGSLFCAISTVVTVEQLNLVEMHLMELGAEGFVELDPSAIM